MVQIPTSHSEPLPDLILLELLEDPDAPGMREALEFLRRSPASQRALARLEGIEALLIDARWQQALLEADTAPDLPLAPDVERRLLAITSEPPNPDSPPSVPDPRAPLSRLKQAWQWIAHQLELHRRGIPALLAVAAVLAVLGPELLPRLLNDRLEPGGLSSGAPGAGTALDPGGPPSRVRGTGAELEPVLPTRVRGPGTELEPVPPLFLVVQGPDDAGSIAALTPIDAGSWRVELPFDARIQLRARAPAGLRPGDRWSAEARLWFVHPDGSTSAVRGGTLTAEGEAIDPDIAVGAPIRLEALPAAGLAPGDVLMFEVRRGADTYRLEVVPRR